MRLVSLVRTVQKECIRKSRLPWDWLAAGARTGRSRSALIRLLTGRPRGRQKRKCQRARSRHTALRDKFHPRTNSKRIAKRWLNAPEIKQQQPAVVRINQTVLAVGIEVADRSSVHSNSYLHYRAIARKNTRRFPGNWIRASTYSSPRCPQIALIRANVPPRQPLGLHLRRRNWQTAEDQPIRHDPSGLTFEGDPGDCTSFRRNTLGAHNLRRLIRKPVLPSRSHACATDIRLYCWRCNHSQPSRLADPDSAVEATVPASPADARNCGYARNLRERARAGHEYFPKTPWRNRVYLIEARAGRLHSTYLPPAHQRSFVKFLTAIFLTAAVLATALALSSCTTAPPPVSRDLSKYDATVTMTGGLVAVGMGYSWGHGTVSYQGTDQTFCVHGLSVGEIAAASLKAEGVVFHLNSLDDFSGRYLAISTGVALARGESAAMLKNERGVTMELETEVRGFRFNIAASGLRITLSGQKGCPVHAGT